VVVARRHSQRPFAPPTAPKRGLPAIRQPPCALRAHRGSGRRRACGGQIVAGPSLSPPLRDARAPAGLLRPQRTV